MRYCFICLLALLCAALVFFGPASMHGAAKGFELFTANVLPALFPFFVCVSALRRVNALSAGGSGFTGTVLKIFAVGCVSGSPSGSMLTDAAFGGDAPLLPLRERSELCAVTNLASPVFIVGAVCTGMLRESRYAPLLVLCHYGGAFLLCAAFLLKNRRFADSVRSRDASVRPAAGILSVLPSAIGDSVSAILRVGGTLVFFMAVIGIFDSISAPLRLGACIRGTLFGMLEMTNGIGIIAGSAVPPRLQCTIIVFLLSFGGICVFMQAGGTAEIAPLHYLRVKLIGACLSGALCYALFPVFAAHVAPVFGILSESLAVSRAVTMGELALCGVLSSIIASLLAVFAARRTPAR